MFIYAGIDEAGYGPMFGPLLVGRAVFAIDDVPSAPMGADGPDVADPPAMWQRLRKAVCKGVVKRGGRVPVNDSKKLHTGAGDGPGLKFLELGALAFAGLLGHKPATVREWLDAMGETCHHDLRHLPWYDAAIDGDADATGDRAELGTRSDGGCRAERGQPWARLPRFNTDGEIAVARGLLTTTATRCGVRVADLGAAVVLEDRFNRMVGQSRSKAATSFTFVAAHLHSVWDRFGHHAPHVVVDRQGGRMHYREPLMRVFPDASLRIIQETETRSAYRLHAPATLSVGAGAGVGGTMDVIFEVEAEVRHMPVALASMISKYTRELMMERFNAWFTARAPQVKPTAGYALDGRRFWNEIEPVLPTLSIDPALLKRMC